MDRRVDEGERRDVIQVTCRRRGPRLRVFSRVRVFFLGSNGPSIAFCCHANQWPVMCIPPSNLGNWKRNKPLLSSTTYNENFSGFVLTRLDGNSVTICPECLIVGTRDVSAAVRSASVESSSGPAASWERPIVYRWYFGRFSRIARRNDPLHEFEIRTGAMLLSALL